MMAHRTRPTLTVVPPSGAPVAERAPKRSDVELLAGLRRGDPTIAEDFYWRVKPIVGRTVRRLLGRLDQDGEDIAQLTMVQLIEALPRYRGDCPLDAWVSAVSANVIYKHIRRRRLERSLFADEPANADGSPWGGARTASASEAIQARQLTARIGEHLATINPDRAWAFLLHDVCGYSLEEIAEVCQTSAAAAQSRLSRGRRELHERIGADPALTELLDGGEGES
jgi:RNA polymerase sigma-70 factor (ECF subfamily)